MADKFFAMDFGQSKVDVIKTGTTTAGKAVELRVTYDATNNQKMALLKALDFIKQRVIEDTWPPA